MFVYVFVCLHLQKFWTNHYETWPAHSLRPCFFMLTSLARHFVAPQASPTGLLRCFMPSGFVLSICSLGLCACILLVSLAHVSCFVLMKIFEKKKMVLNQLFILHCSIDRLSHMQSLNHSSNIPSF